MADVKNFLNPQGDWSNLLAYSAKPVSGQTFDGVMLVSCPSVEYTDGKVYYYPLLTPSTAGVTPPTGGSGWIAYAAADSSGAGTVTSTSVVSANGFAGTVATATTTPAITVSTTVTGMTKGDGTALSAAVAGTDYSAGTSALATGIVKSTTTSGALSIAVEGTDYSVGTAALASGIVSSTTTTGALATLPTIGTGGSVPVTAVLAAWTPVLTCATPGDLSVTYSTQQGSQIRIGNLVVATFTIVTSAFTHTTATGDVSITGLTLAPAGAGTVNYSGALNFSGITKANYTNFNALAVGSSTDLKISCSGDAEVNDLLDIADLPTGGSVILTGTVIYYTA